MTSEDFIIREITSKDNSQIARVIRDVIVEMGAPKVGTAYADAATEKAKDFGFENCYLETLPYMEAAVKLYKRNGFVNLEKPLGNTSHFNCDIWMLKEIN